MSDAELYGVKSRVCCDCHADKAMEEFPKDLTSKTGRSGRCHACWKRAEATQPLTKERKKRCVRCVLKQPLSLYARTTANLVDAVCSPCREVEETERRARESLPAAMGQATVEVAKYRMCDRKARFLSLEAVVRGAARAEAKYGVKNTFYKCPHCVGWHLSTRNGH